MNVHEAKEVSSLLPYLQMLLQKKHLTQRQAQEAMRAILEGADPLQTAAFLTLLKYREPTPEEILGMVSAAQAKAVPVHVQYPTLDIVGTGGDMAGTVNISTGAAVLTAACGVPVLKHGNRASSSRSGSADVLEALGLPIEIPPEQIGHCLENFQIGFLFAPFYHPELKKISAFRKSLKIPTIFNLLGPFLNPAKAPYALIGVADPLLLPSLSQVVAQSDYRKRTLLFHGSGLDELTPLGLITAYDIREGHVHPLEIDPRSLGFSPCSVKDLQGDGPETNARILEDALAGEKGPVADSLIFNAGAALWIFNRAASLKEGIDLARSVQTEGKAQDVLKKWREFSVCLKKGERT